MNGPHDALIAQRFPELSQQLQRAARWVLDHPEEVALLSMREQARLADVAPATMTRLAQALGLGGFDNLRAAYVANLRAASAGLARQAAPRLANGDAGRGMLAALSRHLEALNAPATIDAIDAAADCITLSRRVHVLGLRASHSVAWHLYYALSLVTPDARFLDAPGATGADPLHEGDAQDTLIVVGLRPYARATVALTDLARGRGLRVVALTDSENSPLAARGDPATLVAPTGAPGFLHAMTPAFALAEALAAQCAARLGEAALARLRALDAQNAALDTFLDRAPRGRAHRRQRSPAPGLPSKSDTP